jgi:hypothetical protein
VFFEKETDENDDDADDKHEQRKAVDAIHITDPAARGCIRIFLSYIQVFGYLTKKSHALECHGKDTEARLKDSLKKARCFRLLSRTHYHPGTKDPEAADSLHGYG